MIPSWFCDKFICLHGYGSTLSVHLINVFLASCPPPPHQEGWNYIHQKKFKYTFTYIQNYVTSLVRIRMLWLYFAYSHTFFGLKKAWVFSLKISFDSVTDPWWLHMHICMHWSCPHPINALMFCSLVMPLHWRGQCHKILHFRICQFIFRPGLSTISNYFELLRRYSQLKVQPLISHSPSYFFLSHSPLSVSPRETTKI
jgi:hypothetical protein